MKKVFTLALVMAMAVTSFAQVKSIKTPMAKNLKAEQVQTYTGMEEFNVNFPASTRSIITSAEEVELSQTYYDWQSNMGPRNYTAVWPDGFAVMCYTQSTAAGGTSAFTDRGTGLAIYDPAIGEWEYTDARVEGVKTGFGSISRYKENGLVIAAHGGSDARIFIVEDFREGNRDFGEGIVLPVTTGVDPVWPVVQCSGENLDYINILITNSGATSPCSDPIIYYQYHEGEWLHQYEIIPNLDGDHMTDGGSNITYFMLYDESKPNRVAFILNNAWSDGKAVISEDNGATWSERVFYQHPNINGDFTDTWFMYPRWSNAEFDANDNLHVVYEFNGSSETAGSGKYYPGIGGVSYWSEVLPKNELCVGGIGEVGQPFIMDSTYMFEDIYASAWYWTDPTHDPLPEYFGQLQILDENKEVWPWWNEEMPETYYWNIENRGEHGAYNGGIAEFATMHMDGDRIFAFWSMIAGDEETLYWYSDGSQHYFRLFGCVSYDGGLTWEAPTHLITDMVNMYDEMVYCQVIPYIYTDSEGEYLWLCYMDDQEPGTCVQNDETDWDDNFYRACKVYVHYLDVEDNTLTVAPTINVYPNPANGSFNVTLNNESNVNIYNAVGQLVKTYNNVTELNVNLEAGVYFVNAGNQTVKVVVK